MPQLIRPATVKVVPKDGEIEITLNINISVDGSVTSVSAQGASAKIVDDPDAIPHIIPDFTPAPRVKFGK